MLGFSQDIDVSLDKGWKGSFSAHYLNAERGIPTPIGIPSRGEQLDDEILRLMTRWSKLSGNRRHEFALGYIREDQVYEDPMSELESNIRSSRIHLRYRMDQQIDSELLLRIRVDNDYSQLLSSELSQQYLSETGLYAGLQWTLDPRSTLDIGLRQELRNENLNPMTASASLTHILPDQTHLTSITSATRTLRNPTLNDLYWPELGDEDLVAEEGVALEQTLEYQHRGAEVSLAFYVNRFSDMIAWIPSEDGRFRPRNFNRSRAWVRK